MATNSPATVLIVDDDRSTQRLLADALTKQGFAVVVERDGEWALKAFEKRPFDAVVLDLLLPAMNGYEVAKRIRASERGRRTPIIILSGVYKTELHQREALEKHGAAAFLEKPLKLTQLYDALRRALGPRYPQANPSPPPRAPAEDAEVTEERFADQLAREEAGQVEAEAKSTSGYQAIRGDFSERPFPEVMAEIHQWKATGALLMKRDKVKKIVYFRNGQPTSVKSNVLGECLGRVMVRERMISDAECDESLKRMKASKRQQGTILVEMGCISPHNLVYALTLQLQYKLFEVFSWTRGEFQFNPRVEPPADTVNLEMTTAAVLFEGIRRSFDAPRLAHVFGHAEGLYVHPSENPLYALQDAGLGDDELEVLKAADGRLTVRELRDLGVLPKTESLRLLYALYCARMVDLEPKPASSRSTLALFKIPAASLRPPPLPPSATGASHDPLLQAPLASLEEMPVPPPERRYTGAPPRTTSKQIRQAESALVTEDLPRTMSGQLRQSPPTTVPAPSARTASRQMEQIPDGTVPAAPPRTMSRQLEQLPSTTVPAAPARTTSRQMRQVPVDEAAAAPQRTTSRQMRQVPVDEAAAAPQRTTSRQMRQVPEPGPGDGPRRTTSKLMRQVETQDMPRRRKTGEVLLPELGAADVGAQAPKSDDEKTREALLATAKQMRKANYFELLGVPQDASREEVKRAYFALAKEYHPEKHFGSASAEIRQLAGQIYDLITKAHDTLTDPAERERYANDLASGVRPEVGDDVGKILAAEGKFQKGEELLRQRKFKGAHALFKEAIALYSEEGEFHAYLGWSLFQMNPNDSENIDAALRALERSVALNPKVDKAYLFTGYIYKASGRPDKAEKQFEKAIQCNPDCTEALRELRLLGRSKR